MEVIEASSLAADGGRIIRDDLDGYLFLPPPSPAPVPAIILLHERYGVVEHTCNLAKRFSKQGYAVMVPDLLMGSDLDRDAVRTGAIHGRVPDDRAAEIIDMCIDQLQQDPAVDSARLALMGVCMTGRYSVVVNSRRDDLACSVIYYGSASRSNWEINENQPLSIEEMVATVKVPTLLVFAERDHTMSLAQLSRLRAAYEAGLKSYRMRIFKDMPHGFLNETMPGRYRPEEGRRAEALLFEFLDEVFAGKWPADEVIWDFEGRLSPDYDFSKNVRME